MLLLERRLDESDGLNDVQAEHPSQLDCLACGPPCMWLYSPLFLHGRSFDDRVFILITFVDDRYLVVILPLHFGIFLFGYPLSFLFSVLVESLLGDEGELAERLPVLHRVQHDADVFVM